MNAILGALKVLFNDKNISREAVFQPIIGETRNVRVLIRAPEIVLEGDLSFIKSPTIVIEVMVSDCPEIIPGDEFIIDGQTLRAQENIMKDKERLLWQVDVYAV